MKTMERSLYIVVGDPLSDIGKGWLAASIASTIPSAHVVKIDPLLNPVDLRECDLTQGLTKTTDAHTYHQLGIEFQASQLFLNGNVLLEFLEKNKTADVSPHSTQRLTFGDLAHYLSNKIEENFVSSERKNLVVEVGGTVSDLELSYIPLALSLVASSLQLNVRIVLLSYLDYSEDPKLSQPIKTLHITHAIEETRRVYGQPYLVFFRRRELPESIERNIPIFIENISNRACFPADKIVYLPNFESPLQEQGFIKSLSQLT